MYNASENLLSRKKTIYSYNIKALVQSNSLFQKKEIS